MNKTYFMGLNKDILNKDLIILLNYSTYYDLQDVVSIVVYSSIDKVKIINVLYCKEVSS